MKAGPVSTKLALALWLALCLGHIASAQAVEFDPVASGTTTLSLSAPFSRLLAAHHVSIEVRGGATRGGRKIVLPAASGEFEPLQGTGTVESDGTIVFVAGKRKLPFRAIVCKAKRSPLYAKVGGGQLKIASGAKLTSKREGFGFGFTATELKLTAKIASRLNKKLRLGKAVAPGQALGTLTSRVTPATVHLLPTNRISLAMDPGFMAKLNKLFVSLNPVAPAELGAGPTLSFPIGPESVLAPDAAGGLIKTGGSVELLQLGSAQIFWRELRLEPAVATVSAEPDLEPSPPKPGKQPSGPLLSVAGGQIIADPSPRTISLSGQTATLAATTADALNSSFSDGKTTFAPGETIGTISYLAQGH
jgi:hypothetical protein